MKVMSTPRSLDLCITNGCNLRCKYCGHFESAGDVDQDLSKEEWLKFFDELNRCSVTDVCLSGGEPFLRADLKELIDGLIRNRLRFTILTNGTLITEDLASFIASTGRCDVVQVSIDGSIPSVHDACRGDGNFEKALRGLGFLQKHKVKMTVRVTIHRHNVFDLEAIAKFLLEEVGLRSFSINSANYVGLCRKNAEEVKLTAQERSLAMDSLLKLSLKYNGRISALAGPLAEARSWLKMENARKEQKESLPSGGFLKGCSGPMSKLGVRADGIIVQLLFFNIGFAQIYHG